jgi:hypothetical protein
MAHKSHQAARGPSALEQIPILWLVSLIGAAPGLNQQGMLFVKRNVDDVTDLKADWPRE